MNENQRWGFDPEAIKNEQLHLAESTEYQAGENINPFKAIFESIDFTELEKDSISTSIVFIYHKGLEIFIKKLGLSYDPDRVVKEHRMEVTAFDAEFRNKFSEKIPVGSSFDRDLLNHAKVPIVLSEEESLDRTAPIVRVKEAPAETVPPKKKEGADGNFADKKNIHHSFIEESLPRGDQDDNSSDD